MRQLNTGTNRDKTIALYLRISREDAGKDESYSISNQKKLLTGVARKMRFTKLLVFIDDGITGTSRDRKDFLRMIVELEKGGVGAVMVKDLSRLARDHIRADSLLEEFFPEHDIRFISVSEGIDSAQGEDEFTPFRNLMNEWYARDISKKRKLTNVVKGNAGEPLSLPPYSYKKDPDNPKRWIIDEESAAVVRQIFQMRQSGMAYGKIAAALNEKGILSPRWYWAVHYGNGSCKYSRLWAYATVRSLLNDDVYAGTLTQNCTGSRSYKDKTMIRKPESEWISHEGAHEAIIGPELWEAVQKINQAAKQISANNTPPQASLFTGKLVCADCGHPLVAARETQRRKNGTVKHYTSYFCSRFATTGHSICSWHRIFEISLKNLVLSEIRAHGKAVAADEAAVLDKLKQHIQSASAAQQEDSRQEISRLRRRLEELEQITAKLYEDKVRGAISGDSFSVLIQKNEQERIQKSERLDSLLAGERKAQQDIANIHQWAGTIRQYLDLQELNREIIEELIDRIEVGERTVIDGQRHQDIKIYYRFVGLV